MLPFRTAGADPSVQYLRQGMVDLMQAKLTGEGGPRAADTRSVLAAVRDAGGGDAQDLSEEASAAVAKKVGAGRVLQGSIVGSPESSGHECVARRRPGREDHHADERGRAEGQSLCPDRSAHGPAAGPRRRRQLRAVSALTTTNLDALRAYLDGVAAYRRGAFQNATPLLTRAVDLDSTFALALSALIEADGWHPATTDIKRIQGLAWRYRDRLNPQDQLFLSLRLGSTYPKPPSWDVRIGDRRACGAGDSGERRRVVQPGRLLFHFGRLADIPEPAEVRARQAFEQAFQRDSLFGGPIQHLAALTYVAGDTESPSSSGLAADDRTGLGRRGRPDRALELAPGLPGRCGDHPVPGGLDSTSAQVPQGILFFSPLDSITIVHRKALFDAVHRLSATKAERIDVATARTLYLWNLGRPAEAAKWIDTLATLNRTAAGVQSVLGAFWFGGGPADTTFMTADQLDSWRSWRGDAAAGHRLLQFWRDRAAKDSTNAFYPRAAAIIEAKLAVDRHDPRLRAWSTSPIRLPAAARTRRLGPRSSWLGCTSCRARERSARSARCGADGFPWVNPSRRVWPSPTAWRGGSPRWPTTRSAPSGPTETICGCAWTPSPRACRSSIAFGPS